MSSLPGAMIAPLVDTAILKPFSSKLTMFVVIEMILKVSTFLQKLTVRPDCESSGDVSCYVKRLAETN